MSSVGESEERDAHKFIKFFLYFKGNSSVPLNSSDFNEFMNQDTGRFNN
jgi:hypothetical protein